jgi:hypothetical protein
MRAFWEEDSDIYTKTRQKPWRTFVKLVEAAGGLMSGSGRALVLPLALSLLLVRLRRVRAAMTIGVIVAIGFLLQRWGQPHYLSPATGVILILAVFGLRLIHAVEIRGRPVGTAMVLSIAGITVLASALDLKQAILTNSEPSQAISEMGSRRQVEALLNRDPADHVVIVRYSDDHNPNQEEVYNGPEIDRQKIIWAFDRGLVENRALLRYYVGRKFWLWQPDPPSPRLDPYVDANAP